MTEYYFSEEHEYIRKENEVFYMGISNFAQEQLGDIVFVELPDVGSTFKKGETIATVESVKAASDVYAPCDCTVVSINTTLEEKPETVNENAETNGWFMCLTINDETQLKELMSQDTYTNFIQNVS